MYGPAVISNVEI